MKKPLVLLVLVLLSMPGVFAEIGCVQEGSFLRCFNQGLAPTTYYDIVSGFLQHTNSPERLGDASYVYGYGRVDAGIPVIFGTEVIPNILSNRSDNTSYYWVDGGFVYTQGSNQFVFHKNHSQALYSDLVNITFSFMSTRRITGNNYFFHGLRNVDVELDGLSDQVRIVWFDDNATQFYMNSTSPVTGMAKEVYINGITYSYMLLFSHPVSLWFNNSNHLLNGDLTFGEYIGTLQAGQTYRYSYEWIDACVLTCIDPTCCNYLNAENATGTTLEQGLKYYGYAIRFTPDGATCGPGDSMTYGGCALALQQNSSAIAFSTVMAGDVDRGLKCFNSTCNRPSYVVNYPYTDYSYTVKASAIKDTTTRFYMVKPKGTDTSTTDSWTTTRGIPNILLDFPANNTVTTGSSQEFRANWTGNMDCDNMSLIFNNTINETFDSGLWDENMSITVNFDNYWSGYWNATCCYSNNCDSAAQRNYTFTKSSYTNITLWQPNNISFHYRNVTFSVNTSGNTLDNLSIYVNGTLYYIQYNNSNISTNLTINQSGNLTWTAIGCKDGTCSNAWNEYYWFFIFDISNSYIIWLISGGLGILFLKKKKWIFPAFLIAWGISVLLIEQSEITNIIAIIIPTFGVSELLNEVRNER